MTRRNAAGRSPSAFRHARLFDRVAMNAYGKMFDKHAARAMHKLATIAREDGYDRSDALRICYTNLGFAFAVVFAQPEPSAPRQRRPAVKKRKARRPSVRSG